MASGTHPKYADGTDTGWVDIEKGSALIANQGTLRYRKIGQVVQVQGYNLQLQSAAVGTSVILGRVPSGYRPDITVCIFFYLSGGAYYAGYINADSGSNAGNIYIFKGSASSVPASTNILFSNTYFVD